MNLIRSSYLYIFAVELRLLNEVTVPRQQLLNPEQVLLVSRRLMPTTDDGPGAEATHIGLLAVSAAVAIPLCLLLDPELHVTLLDLVLLILVDHFLLHLEHGAVNVRRVELDPLWSQHEVNVFVIFVAPVLEHLAQVELADDFVRRY